MRGAAGWMLRGACARAPPFALSYGQTPARPPTCPRPDGLDPLFGLGGRSRLGQGGTRRARACEAPPNAVSNRVVCARGFPRSSLCQRAPSPNGLAILAEHFGVHILVLSVKNATVSETAYGPNHSIHDSIVIYANEFTKHHCLLKVSLPPDGSGSSAGGTHTLSYKCFQDSTSPRLSNFNLKVSTPFEVGQTLVMTKQPLLSDEMPAEFYKSENIFGLVEVLQNSAVDVSLKNVKVRAVTVANDENPDMDVVQDVEQTRKYFECESINALVFYLVDLDLWMDENGVPKKGPGGKRGTTEPRLKYFNDLLRKMIYAVNPSVEYVEFEGSVDNDRHQVRIKWGN